MEQQSFKYLTDEQLLEEQKKLKAKNITNAVILGVFIGIAVYSAVKKGPGFFTVFPLFFAYILLNNRKYAKALNEELKSRNLK